MLRTSLVHIAVVLAVVGCPKADDATAVESGAAAPAPSATVAPTTTTPPTTTATTTATATAAPAIPAACPLTVAAGFEAVTAQGGETPTGKTCMVMAKGVGATGQVAGFYDMQLKSLGFAVTRNDMKMGELETTMLAGTKGKGTLNVSIMRDPRGSSIQILGEGL